MSKYLTELIRDANRIITPADRHAILDLIEGQAGRIASLKADNDTMLDALAACRDAFPIPEPGAALEGDWGSAMGDPLDVPAYIRAALASSEAQAGEAVNRLFEVLMRQNIVIGNEAYLALRGVGVPPSEDEFVLAINRAIAAAKEKENG